MTNFQVMFRVHVQVPFWSSFMITAIVIFLQPKSVVESISNLWYTFFKKHTMMFGDNLGEAWQDKLICWEQSRSCWIFKTRLASIESKLAGKFLSVHEIKWLCLCPQQAIPRTTGAIFCTPHSVLWWKESSLQPFSPSARVHAGEVIKPWAASPAPCQTVCLSLQQTLVNRFVYAGLGMFTSLKFTSLSLTIILPCRHH